MAGTDLWWAPRRRPALRTWLRLPFGLGAAAVAVTLLLPWIHGTDDGGPYSVAGWEARPAYSVLLGLIVLAWLALAALPELLHRAPWAPAALAAVALGLTRWLAHHNDYYERPDLAYGIYLSAAVQAFVLAISVALVARRSRPR
jgi:uncharacterized membrane protein